MDALRSIVLACSVAGCVGGISSPGGGSGSNVPDAKAGATADSGGIHWIDAMNGSGNGLPCLSMSPPPGDGHHNPGMDCMQGCHNHGFTLCGTLYANATGNIPFAGAHVTISDHNGQQIDMVAMTNGNFYTSAAIAFPVTVLASDCPSATKMNASASTGHCNQAGCHPGGTSLQMHLP
jgi:hypothetical protein